MFQEEADAIETQRKKDKEVLELERSKKMVIAFIHAGVTFSRAGFLVLTSVCVFMHSASFSNYLGSCLFLKLL